MKEESVKKAKEKYRNDKMKLLEEQKRQERIKELEQNPLVKEYIKLSKETPEKKIELEEYFEEIALENSNNIKVYLGTFGIFQGKFKNHPIYFNGETEEVYINRYKDLETLEEVDILTTYEVAYERRKKLIFPDFESPEEALQKFQTIREKFLYTILEKSQKEAIQELIKEENIKMQYIRKKEN